LILPSWKIFIRRNHCRKKTKKIDFLDLLDVTIFLVALMLTGAVMIGWGSAFLFLFACLAGIIHTCSLAY